MDTNYFPQNATFLQYTIHSKSNHRAPGRRPLRLVTPSITGSITYRPTRRHPRRRAAAGSPRPRRGRGRRGSRAGRPAPRRADSAGEPAAGRRPAPSSDRPPAATGERGGVSWWGWCFRLTVSTGKFQVRPCGHLYLWGAENSASRPSLILL